MWKRVLLIFLILSSLLLSNIIIVNSVKDSAEQYALKLGIEKSAIKIISRLDKDNHFDELEKDFITWLASQDKESQFKLAFKYAFDGKITAQEMSEILSNPISNSTESEKSTNAKSEIEYLMLDDFEDEMIIENNRWKLGKEIKEYEGTIQNVYIDYECGAENSNSSLCLEYHMESKSGPFLGHWGLARLEWDSEKKGLTEYDGIIFFIKVTDTRKEYYLHVGEGTCHSGSYEPYYYHFQVDSKKWIKIKVPLNNFTLDGGHGINNILELNKVRTLVFEVADTIERQGGDGKVWIDKIALYKEPRKDILVETSLNNIQKEIIFDFEDKTKSVYKNWNIGYGKQGDGTKQRVYIDSNSGANNTNSSLCCEIIKLPFGGEKSEVASSINLKAKDSNLSQYTGIGFFIKTSCLKSPINLIFVEGYDEDEEEGWVIRFSPSDSWTEMKIPFNSLELSSSSNIIDQKLDLSKVSEIFIGQWGPLSEIKEKFKIWIDEISLYKAFL